MITKTTETSYVPQQSGSGVGTFNTLLTAEQVADLMQLDLSTIKKWTAKRKIPHYKIGNKAVRYDPKRIARWLNGKEIRSTGSDLKTSTTEKPDDMPQIDS